MERGMAMSHSAEDIRLIIIQISFSNPQIVPDCVRKIKQETEKDRKIRTSRNSGVTIIHPTENCSLVGFIGDICEAYELVDAFHQERIPKKVSGQSNRYFGQSMQEYYQTLRFVFARKDFVSPSPEFQELQDKVLSSLMGICDMALWRVRVFNNPYFQDGKEIIGQRAISVNLENRSPLFHPNGERIMVYPVNSSGEKIRDSKVQIEPENYLCFEDNEGNIIIRIEQALQLT